jgi:hypothetical protein
MATKRDAVPWVAGGLLLLMQAARLWLLRVRGFDPDEFQHLHGAWLVSKGFLPYRDYFEHHTPWFHFLLAPFLHLFPVETDPGAAVHFLFFARVLMWILTAAILYLTYRLGRFWRGPAVGLVAAVLLAGTKFFLDKTLEVRPDVLSCLLWLAALNLALDRMQGRLSGRWSARRLLLLCGICLGGAVMTSQKLLMVLPGFALSWFLFSRRDRGIRLIPPRGESAGRAGSRWTEAAFLASGWVLPVALTAAYFAFRRGLGPFVQDNFLLNAGWSARLDPRHLLGEFAKESPVPALLGLGGIVLLALRKARGERLAGPDGLILFGAVGPILALAVLPIAWPQYYLTFLPLLALLGAECLQSAWSRLARRPAPAAGISGLGLSLLLVLISLQPALQLRQAFAWTNAEDLHEIRYVAEHTTPGETVLDGWSGRGVFRPHAWFYFFLHNEVRSMRSDVEIEDLLAGLRTGRIVPRLIVFDAELRSLSPEVTAFLAQNYQPTGVGQIWRRKKA